ncbi:FadR/GntR family transcriptional regulator [Phenylobacterium sp. Root700]|uniref:FadR/GntR family transcriptional regulator n=1 Tax=Phenylobacterium sp. Root700 TaxID=1736591 RepID=UPI0006F971A7|nr:FadR/GntR family transcriptional regulator [Phenylobacterium sp. Root700]KRB48839.1 GntR family transcriptional regulator [Phenylobacterium sp. Root700]
MTRTTAGARKLYQQVVAAVGASIERGQYKPGQRLPSERDLAEEFSVSRPTVREAMLALEIRGLVEARHGSGIYVTDTPPVEAAAPDLDIGAFELTEARVLFEGEAAALAATTITEEQLVELEAILVEMVEENAGDAKGEQADRRFHVAIAEATRNAAIVTVIETLWDLRYRSPLCRHMLDRARLVGVKPRIDEHRRLLDALKARDPQRARKEMRDHLERVIEGLLAATEIEAVERARTEVAKQRTEYARRRVT